MRDDEIKIKDEYGVLGVFLIVEDVGFGERKVVRLGFEASMIELKGNDIKATFLLMADNIGLTVLTIGDNWNNDKMGKNFSNGVRSKYKDEKNMGQVIKMGV